MTRLGDARIRLLRRVTLGARLATSLTFLAAASTETLRAQEGEEDRQARSAAVSDSLGSAHEGTGGLRSSDLVWAGVFVGGLLLVEPAERLEEAIALAVGEGNVRGRALASLGEVAGHGFMAYGLAGGTFMVGTLAGEPVAARVGLRSLESLAIATGATALLKLALGRERPLWSPDDSDVFRPFELALDRSSFPSGHTAHMFALAGTVSRELAGEAGWVPYVAYPVAGLVGTSRVLGQKHWVTDVVSGAAVGILSSRLVGRLHEGDRAREGRQRMPSARLDPLLVPLADGGILLGLGIRH